MFYSLPPDLNFDISEVYLLISVCFGECLLQQDVFCRSKSMLVATKLNKKEEKVLSQQAYFYNSAPFTFFARLRQLTV